MGLFDYFLRGPELSKSDAEVFSIEIALILHQKKMTIIEFLSRAEEIIEGIFLQRFPNHSIKSEQTKEIVKCGLDLHENEDKYLDRLIRDREYFDSTGSVPHRYIEYEREGQYIPPSFNLLTQFKNK